MWWDESLQEAHKLIESEETNKRELWRLAYEVKRNAGSKGLREFSSELRDTFGRTKSYHTLRQYAYIYEVTQLYELPEDLPYTIIRAIASSDDPQALTDKINKEGLNSHEIMEIILAEKPKKIKLIKCPHCGHEFNPNEKKKEKKSN